MNKANTNKHIWTCLSPQEDMWHLSSWTPSIWGRNFSPWVFFPPIEMIKLLCDLSLSPFDINFQEGFFWMFVSNGFGPWVTEQRSKSNVMLVEDKNHWVELEQKTGTSGTLFSLQWDRWHWVVVFGGTELVRFDQKQQTGVTEFITEKTLVTSAH